MRLNLTTLLRFLIGRTDAIEALAGNRATLLLGFVFCISAALARHYDGKDLLHEPWFLLAPAGASILTSSLLFAAMFVIGSIRARRILDGATQAYVGFLGLYWMTAPLAWLYGIPYERFLNEVDAAQMNVWTLELVSVWRVILMSRVFSVLVPCSFPAAFANVGTIALTLVYAALVKARMPLIDFMGGVRVPPSVEPVVTAYFLVLFFGFFALILGWIAVLVCLFVPAREWSLARFHGVLPGEAGREVWILACLVILVFSAALPVPQREQQLRHDVEIVYKSGKVEEALALLAAHQRSEFPPHWTPPPWPEYADGARDPNMVRIVEAIQNRRDTPEWIVSIYRDKAKLFRRNNRTDPKVDMTSILAFIGEIVPEKETGTSDPEKETPFRIEFSNPQRSSLFIQATLGTGECAANPVLSTRKLEGDAGWVLSATAMDKDRLCYRIRYSNSSPAWSEWREIKRAPGSDGETYQVTLP